MIGDEGMAGDRGMPQETAEGFERFGFSAPLMRSLREAGMSAPSRAQAACIPPLLAGADLLAQVYAGMGRTLAFVLPLLQQLRLSVSPAQVLVLTPSDLVSLHVAEIFQHFGRHLPEFRVLPINHQSAAIQLRQLRRGAHVVIGTPRRILHYTEDHGLDISVVRRLVLDEADVMLKEGFRSDIQTVLGQMSALRQRAIFATTASRELDFLVQETLRNPVVVSGEEAPHGRFSVRMRYWLTERHGKLGALARLIETEPNFDAALVFVRDGARAQGLAERLKALGYAAAALDGQVTPEARGRLAEQLELGELDFLVGTDQAASQLMLNRITHVVSYDMPCDGTSHEGRVVQIGRAGQRGTVVLLVTPHEMGMLHSLERQAGQAVPPLELPERIR